MYLVSAARYIDRSFGRAIGMFRNFRKFLRSVSRNDTRQGEREKKSVSSANAMEANERRDEENDAAASPVQYVGQTTIIVRRFLVYYTASN